MPEIFTIKASDLVLKVSEYIDPARFDISKYEAFLDALCGTTEFQKEAIMSTAALVFPPLSGLSALTPMMI